jgi:hypothetical protein
MTIILPNAFKLRAYGKVAKTIADATQVITIYELKLENDFSSRRS